MLKRPKILVCTFANLASEFADRAVQVTRHDSKILGADYLRTKHMMMMKQLERCQDLGANPKRIKTLEILGGDLY